MGTAAELAAGLALIAAGVAESWRRPASWEGRLLAGAGIGWFFVEWNNPGLGSAAAFTFGLVVSTLGPPLVAHAALAYPTGRLDSRRDLSVMLFAYAGAGLMLGLGPALFFDPGRQGCGLCPANLVLVRSEPGLADGLLRIGLVLGLASLVAVVAAGTVRMARAGRPLRRVLWPMLAPAGCYLVLVGADFLHSLPRGTLSNDPLEYRLWLGEAALLVLMALAVAWGWVRDRRARSAVVRLVIDAARSSPPGGLRDVLAGMLADPSLDLAYPVGVPDRHVDVGGQPTSIDPDRGQQVTPLVRGGRTVAVLRHQAGLLDDPGLVGEVAAASRLALENERLQAEVLAQLQDLRAAQARIVVAGDGEARRLERDLHDGAQQRLIGLLFSLRLVGSQLSVDPAPRLTSLIGQAEHELRLAIDELRELAHGIYPAVLADEGLAAAVEALAERSPIPVTLGDLPEERFPDPVESAGYFLIAEAGQLAALAGAKGITVDIERHRDRLNVKITEDGDSGSGQELEAGLSDVADRVGALGGTIRVENVADGPMTIRAEIPCGW
jgi:signal transduction histidine kinase